MPRILVIIALTVSAAAFAQDHTEEFVHARLFGIVADTNSLGPRATAASLDAEIAKKISSDSSYTREGFYKALADRILNDARWLTSDKVTRAASSFVGVLIFQKNMSLLDYFQVSLERLNADIDIKLTKKYGEPSRSNTRQVPQVILGRMEALAQIYEKIQAFKQSRSWATRMIRSCAILLSRPAFNPHL